eukprot:SAG11_NODE_894_length_6647_cov_2.924099_1_plen_31_part_00
MDTGNRMSDAGGTVLLFSGGFRLVTDFRQR